MRAITKVSDISCADLAEYLRLDEVSEGDTQTLANLYGAAVSYIANYTGLNAEQMDQYNDLVIVVLVLVQDMWDNRAMYVDSGNVNKVVDTILNLHQVNLL